MENLIFLHLFADPMQELEVSTCRKRVNKKNPSIQSIFALHNNVSSSFVGQSDSKCHESKAFLQKQLYI